jgi:hypothetical protein
MWLVNRTMCVAGIALKAISKRVAYRFSHYNKKTDENPRPSGFSDPRPSGLSWAVNLTRKGQNLLIWLGGATSLSSIRRPSPETLGHSVRCRLTKIKSLKCMFTIWYLNKGINYVKKKKNFLANKCALSPYIAFLMDNLLLEWVAFSCFNFLVINYPWEMRYMATVHTYLLKFYMYNCHFYP